MRGCALAIHRHPEFNASWGGDHLDYAAQVNVGIAIALPRERGGGLVVASIRDADRKSLRAISLESKQFAEKARTRGLTLEEMADATFTISNLGMFGVDHFYAIITPPQSSILAVGGMTQRPIVRDGRVVVGTVTTLGLSVDHRVLDGVKASQFLAEIKRLLESPEELLGDASAFGS